MSSSRGLVLIGNFLPDRQESMQRFGQLLSDGMTARGWSVQTWRPEPRFTRWVRTYRYGGLPKYLGYLDKFFVFPRQLRARRRALPADTIFHIVDHSNAVYAEHFQGSRLLVTCHDLLQIRSALGEFPQNRVSGTGQRYQRWILDHLSRLKLAVCVSEKTRTDLLRLAKLPPEAAKVVYLGLNYPYRPMARAEAEVLLRQTSERNGTPPSRWQEALNGRFLLGVGGAQWYKNRTGIVSIFTHLQKQPGSPRHLVLVGPPLEEEQEAVLQQHGLSGAVLRLSGVSNEELRAIYSLAAALLFPSWEEGFGWPIVEAQACGCPVFTSNRPPMTEIGGEAAGYVDPADPISAAAAIAQAWPDLARMSARGLEGVRRWDVARMLEGYEQLYSIAAQEHPTLAAVGS